MKQVGSADHYGFQFHSSGDGECTLLVPFRKDFERPGRVVAGPLFMAAADVAMWLAIITRLGVSDGSVTAYTGKCELGHGLYTAQTQLVAEIRPA